MTKFRPQRGTLDEAMLEVVEVENLRALANHLKIDDLSRIRTEHYMFDARTCWDTHVVIVDGNAVGFTNRLL